MKYDVIRRVNLEGGCMLEMAAMHAHFVGHEPQDVIQITYLEPACEPNSYHCNNSEYYKIDDVETATLAFDERLSKEPWKASSNVTWSNRSLCW